MMRNPARATQGRGLASRAGFLLSSEEGVGRLLAVLAAATPIRGRVLEMGTGTGVGTSWIVAGLASRSDVEVVTVERDPSLVALAAEVDWPSWVRRVEGDVLRELPTLGTFDLIFADAEGGKWICLERTIAALRQGGLLVVDDMTPLLSWSQDEAVNQARVRETLIGHPLLVSCEVDWETGVIMSARSSSALEAAP